MLLGVAAPAIAVVKALSPPANRGLSAPEAVYEYASAHGTFTAEQLSTLSAGVRYAHSQYFLSSGREPVFVLSCIAFWALAVFHFRLAARTSREANKNA